MTPLLMSEHTYCIEDYIVLTYVYNGLFRGLMILDLLMDNGGPHVSCTYR